MKKTSIGASLSSSETIAGFVYLAFQFFLLPTALYWIDLKLGSPMNEAEINFLFYIISFLAVTVIFHDFLGHSGRQAIQHPVQLCQAVVLGLAGYYVSLYCVTTAIYWIAPSFANYNDQAISIMGEDSAFLIAVSTVLLAPPVEECLFRGLIFRNLYGRNRIFAYAVSILGFAAVHILGYLGQYSPLEMLLAVLQYVPGGLCLAWCYAKSGTIFGPIVMHAIINAITVGIIF